MVSGEGGIELALLVTNKGLPKTVLFNRVLDHARFQDNISILCVDENTGETEVVTRHRRERVVAFLPSDRMSRHYMSICTALADNRRAVLNGPESWPLVRRDVAMRQCGQGGLWVPRYYCSPPKEFPFIVRGLFGHGSSSKATKINSPEQLSLHQIPRRPLYQEFIDVPVVDTYTVYRSVVIGDEVVPRGMYEARFWEVREGKPYWSLYHSSQ